jgi:hypothetical protein
MLGFLKKNSRRFYGFAQIVFVMMKLGCCAFSKKIAADFTDYHRLFL